MAVRSPETPASPGGPGYSGTPLAKKLGIADGSRVLVGDAPDGFERWLEPLPAGTQFVTRSGNAVDIAIVFARRRDALRKRMPSLRATLRPDAAVWICWPKRAAKIDTDITEDTIRADALPLGFVDIKVCAVSDVWSGLKLVVRKELR